MFHCLYNPSCIAARLHHDRQRLYVLSEVVTAYVSHRPPVMIRSKSKSKEGGSKSYAAEYITGVRGPVRRAYRKYGRLFASQGLVWTLLVGPRASIDIQVRRRVYVFTVDVQLFPRQPKLQSCPQTAGRAHTGHRVLA